MYYKNIIAFSLALTLITSCSTYEKFTYNYVNFDVNKDMKIVADVPKKYKLVKINEKELKLVYEDSAIIFFSYDKLSGTQTNRKNRFAEGIDVIFRENYNDSIFLEGIDKNNLYWKEYFLDDIIVGYTNVSILKKEEFDKVILSLKRK